MLCSPWSWASSVRVCRCEEGRVTLKSLVAVEVLLLPCSKRICSGGCMDRQPGTDYTVRELGGKGNGEKARAG